MTDRGRRDLIIWLVILSIPVVCILLIVLAYQMTFGWIGDQRRAARLPESSLFASLSRTPDALDLILFRDGSHKWYAIADPAGAADAKIKQASSSGWSFLFGEAADTMSCGGGRIVVWAVQDGHVVDSIARCKKAHLDLSDLYRFAEKTELVRQRLNAEGVRDVTAKIASDDTLVGVRMPYGLEDFDHGFEMTFPHRWLPDGETPYMMNKFEADVHQIIEAQMPGGDTSFSLRFRAHIDSTFGITVQGADGEEDRYLKGVHIMRDGQSFVLPNLDRVEHVTMSIRCDLPTCDAIQGMDFSSAYASMRDLEILDAAFETAEIVETSDGAIVMSDLTESDLRRDEIVMTTAVETFYDITFANLAP